MNKQRHMTAFYLETVLMMIIFAIVIAILAQVFSLAKTQSGEAERMTHAVCLAQNAAEAVAAADSKDTLLRLLEEDGNASLDAKDGGAAVLTAYYDADMHPLTAAEAEADEEALRVETTWNPDASGTGIFVSSDISVFPAASETQVYTLNTGIYLREGGTQ